MLQFQSHNLHWMALCHEKQIGARHQSGFPMFRPCQRQDANVLPKRRQSHQGDKLCDVGTVPLVARWPRIFGARSDADGEPHSEPFDLIVSWSAVGLVTLKCPGPLFKFTWVRGTSACWLYPQIISVCNRTVTYSKKRVVQGSCCFKNSIVLALGFKLYTWQIGLKDGTVDGHHSL